VRRNSTSEFVAVCHETDKGRALLITPHHLIFASLDAFSAPTDMVAADVKAGMYVWTTTGAGADGLQPSRVTSAQVVFDKGFMSPMTASGTVVVEGVLASNYLGERANDHTLKHWTYLPKRVMHALLPWMNPKGELPQDQLTLWALYWSIPIVQARKFVLDGVIARIFSTM